MCYLQIIIYYLFRLFEVLYLLISAFYGGRFIILFAFVVVLVFTKFPVGPDEDEDDDSFFQTGTFRYRSNK